MLGPKLNQAGISTTAPPILAYQFLSLPAILHKLSPNSISSYSKAPRGLFVLLRVTSIFTRSSISPGPSLRQCPTRYAFRAGRNLPDKEFRYLRTVIVTAAVHRGFISELAPLHLTFRHWAGVSPYTSSFEFAETCVFGKQSAGPFLCGPHTLQMCIFHPQGRSFSRSYGSILPSSLTRVFPIALVFSTRLPVSVCGTGTKISSLRGFSCQLGLNHFRPYGSAYNPSDSLYGFTCKDQHPTSSAPGRPSPGWPTLLRPPFAPFWWYRNINLLSIAYALRPRLRPD